MLTAAESESLTAQLSVLRNYPDRPEGAAALAQTLQQVAAGYHEAESLIAECLRYRQYCPTPYELRQLIADRAPGEWSSSKPSPCHYGICCGDGWERQYYLHTRQSQPGRGMYMLRERITEEQYKSLATRVDWQKQIVCEGVKRCRCQIQSNSVTDSES